MPFPWYFIQLWQTAFVISGPNNTKQQPELPIRSSYCFIEHGNWPSLCGCFRVPTRIHSYILQVEAARHTMMTNICGLQEAHAYSSVGEYHQIVMIYCAIPSCSSSHSGCLCLWFLLCFVPLCLCRAIYLLVCHCIHFFWCTGQQWTVMYSPKCSQCVETVLFIQAPHFRGICWIVNRTAIQFSCSNRAFLLSCIAHWWFVCRHSLCNTEAKPCLHASYGFLSIHGCHLGMHYRPLKKFICLCSCSWYAHMNTCI